VDIDGFPSKSFITVRGSGKTEDGDVREFIAVEYQTEPINGIPLNQVYVRYTGDDPRLADRKVLKLAEAEQYFREWQGTRWQ